MPRSTAATAAAFPPVEWRDPPPPTRGRTGWWRDRLAPLVERPGVWAMVYRSSSHKGATQLVYRLRERRQVDYPPGVWEFSFARPGADDPAEVFARYIGPGK